MMKPDPACTLAFSVGGAASAVPGVTVSLRATILTTEGSKLRINSGEATTRPASAGAPCGANAHTATTAGTRRIAPPIDPHPPRGAADWRRRRNVSPQAGG